MNEKRAIDSDIRALGVMWVIVLAQAVILSFLRGGTSIDGAEQLLYSQYFDFGYGRSHPPLYTWMLLALQSLLGTTILAENLLKFTLAGIGMSGMWHLGRMVWGRHAAIPVMLSVMLIPEIAWHMQRSYSHSVLVFALVPWLFASYLNLMSAGVSAAGRQWAAAFQFGVIAGLAVLAKYNVFVVVIALLIADAVVLGRRSILLRPPFLLAAAAAAAVTTPHILWALSNTDALFALTFRFEMGAAGNPLIDRIFGVGRFIVAILVMCFLLVGIALWSPGRVGLYEAFQRRLSARQRIFAIAGLLSLGVFFVSVLVSGANEVKPRWILPALFPLLAIGVGLIVRQSDLSAQLLRKAGLLAVIILLPLTWIYSVLPGKRTSFDYAALTAEMRARTGADLVVIRNYAHFANLRLGNADLRIASPDMPFHPGVDSAQRPVAVQLADDNADTVPLTDFAATLGFAPAPGVPPLLLTLDSWFFEGSLKVSVQPLVRSIEH